MAVTALIIFDQFGPGTAGQALAGVAGSLVTVTNNDNTGVTSWTVTLLDVPPDSALIPGVLATAATPTPSATFTPDKPGSYRIQLDVSDGAATNTDIRNFGVPNARGVIIPSYQRNPDPLPLAPSLNPRAKPDEQNYGGQSRGWTGNRADGQLEFFFLTYKDDVESPTFIHTTPFTITDSYYDTYFVDTGSGALTVILPSGARVGQSYKLIDFANQAFTNNVTVNTPGGHNFIDGTTSRKIFANNGVLEVVYVGDSLWVVLRDSDNYWETNLVPPTDWATFITTIVGAAAYIRPVQMLAGAWSCITHNIQLDKGSYLIGSNGATISYDCRPLGGGAEASSVFWHNIQPAATTTVAVLGVVGDRTVTVADGTGITIGDRIRIEDTGKCVRGYEVKDKAGALITLDAPLPYPFPIASTVTVIPLVSQCRDIRIDGNGMNIVPVSAGSLAEKLIELFGAWDCVISDLVLDATSATLMGCSFDMGGVRNKWERIVQRGNVTNPSNGIALEGNRDSSIVKCSTRDNAYTGYALSCTSCLIEDCTSDHDYFGVFMGELAGNVVGCTDCTVRSTVIRNSQSSAVAVGYGSSYNVIDNVTTINCQAGIEFGAFTGAASHHNRAVNCTLRGGNNGLITIDGSHDNLLENCTMYGQTGANAYLTSGPVTFVNSTMESDANGNSASCIVVAGVTAYCDGLTQIFNGGADLNGRFYLAGAGSTLIGRNIRSVQNANKAAGTYVVFNATAGGAVMDLSDVDVTFFDNTTGIRSVYVAGGGCKVHITNYKQTNGYCAFGFIDSTSTIQIDGKLDITNIGAGGLVLFEGGGATQAQCNVGSFTSAGTAPIDVAIPQIGAQSVVRIWAPGGVQMEVEYATTPGTGIRIWTVLSAGTYFWQLVSSGATDRVVNKSVTVNTTPYSLVAADGDIWLVDTSASAITINLPSSLRTGQVLQIKDSTQTAFTHNITINLPGGHTFSDGTSSATVFANGGMIEVMFSGGTAWHRLRNTNRIDHIALVKGDQNTSDTGGYTRIGAESINSSLYPAGAVWTLKAILETTNASDAAQFRLYNFTDSSSIGTLSSTSTTPEEKTTTVTMTAGNKVYFAQLEMGAGVAPDRVTCCNAELEVVYAR